MVAFPMAPVIPPANGRTAVPRGRRHRPGGSCDPWSVIEPQIDDVMSRAKCNWNEDALVPIIRNGRIEDVYWTYGHSPVFDDEGRIRGQGSRSPNFSRWPTRTAEQRLGTQSSKRFEGSPSDPGPRGSRVFVVNVNTGR